MRGFDIRTLAFAVPALVAAALGVHGLMAHGGSGLSCPVRQPSSTELEAQRMAAMTGLRGRRPAPSRNVLGFVLDVTTRSDFEKHLRTRLHREPCIEELGGALLRCDTSSDATPDEHTEIVARFAPNGVLVGLDRVTTSQNLESAAKGFRSATEHLRLIYGEPARSWGEPSPAYLEAPLRQTGIEYRFEDCAIDWTLTQLGGGSPSARRLVTREQVRAIPKGPAGGGS